MALVKIYPPVTSWPHNCGPYAPVLVHAQQPHGADAEERPYRGFPNLAAACKTHGPEGFKHICPEALEIIGRILDLLPEATRAEHREFMAGMRRLFFGADDLNAATDDDVWSDDPLGDWHGRNV